MKYNAAKTILSLTLALSMASPALSARADSTVKTSHVSATAVNGGAFIVNEHNLLVSSDEAEKFGYTDKLTDGVSSLDVLVKMHEIKFGSDFTPETAADYLALNNDGWITRLFNDAPSSASYSANYSEKYATYDLYGEIPDGGAFELYYQQDITYYSDVYFHLPDTAAFAGTETVINAAPFKGAQLAFANGLSIEPIEGAIADEDGNIKVTFNKPGVYYITLTGSYDQEVYNWSTGEMVPFNSPIIPSVTKLTVMPADFDNIYKATAQTLLARNLTYSADYNTEWAVMGLARAGYEIPDTYYSSLSEAKEQMTKATDFEKAIIVLTASGKRADNAILEKLSSDKFVNTNGGLYSSIYALLALNSADYEIPVNDDTEDQNTAEKMINNILSYQIANGGFALSPNEGAGIDTTAMAVQALAKYESVQNVSESIKKAFAYIDENLYTKNKYTPDTCSSLAQVIVAYTETGKDPTEFVEKMLEYYDAKGGFIYNGSTNEMSTTQAFYALVSYYRWAQNENSLYDMTDALHYSILSADDTSVKIYSPKATTAALIGADFTDGAFTGVKSQTVQLKKGSNTFELSGFDKIMLWDSLNSMKPLCGAETVK